MPLHVRRCEAWPGCGSRAAGGVCLARTQASEQGCSACTGALQIGGEFRGDCARGRVDQTVLSRLCGQMDQAPFPQGGGCGFESRIGYCLLLLARRRVQLRKAAPSNFAPERWLAQPANIRLDAGAWHYCGGVPLAACGETPVRIANGWPGSPFRAARTLFMAHASCERWRGCARGTAPAIAQLAEHLTVEACSDQMVPGSIPGGRMFTHRALDIVRPPSSSSMLMPGCASGRSAP